MKIQPKYLMAVAFATVALGLAGCQQLRDTWCDPNSDSAIASEISERLGRDTMLASTAWYVSVENGTATISGSVENSGQRARALALVEATEGVYEIVDLITVR